MAEGIITVPNKYIDSDDLVGYIQRKDGSVTWLSSQKLHEWVKTFGMEDFILIIETGANILISHGFDVSDELKEISKALDSF